MNRHAHSMKQGWAWVALAFGVLALAGCGGSGGTSTPSPGPAPSPPPPPSGDTTLQARISAATSTAQNNAECVGINPFYWEVGDGSARLASGAVGTRYQGDTVMSIASASKWLYSTYWVQRTKGVLSASDVKFFNFQSGYSDFSSCVGASTVAGCLNIGSNGSYDASTDGRFAYGGGHMQKHAALNGLGALDNAALATEIKAQLGNDVGVAYGQPQLAGGGNMSANEYAKVLRKIVAGTLLMKDALGTHPVCTNTDIAGACPTAVNTPSPRGEQWHYSVGHWVEDDPKVGDGAFSSPGAFGFYPWVDKSKTWYGIVAREDLGGALTSAYCGRAIRKAWLTGVAQ